MEKTPSKYIVLAGTFFTSLSSIIIRFSTAPALAISSYRMLFTCIMLLPVIIKNRDEFTELNKKNLILCIISGIFLAFHYATWISSIKLTTIANSTILVSCSPIFVALANYFIIKEKLSKKMIISIAVSLAGTIIIALESADASAGNMMLGNTLAFLGAIFVAGYLVIGGIVRKNLSAGAYVFIVYSVSTVVLFIMCLLSGTSIYPYPPREFTLFISLAFFCSILGHTLYNYMVKYVSSTLISVSTLSEPIFASLMALLIFKEIPSLYTLLGGIIIIAGILNYLITQNNERLKTKN
ncbi:DMT family transporter [Sedimentibacter hydroxybenzoicus DSM 7310]|uniref:DMT family transporter n=1 Tax=Sedimentibacter hydroxybenzoicus DSM 7310 TaxID=1123245 RepID=A0A974GVE5_SEDHY|nr:DMT family transporter [Sedimentibacter hydroxybenzoicus]NYB73297.1 DMT family transporter [Sedimentibacter hydroxybenzoicus DSM 7310]